MEYRSYGQTGEKISLLGFGAMRLPFVGGEESNIDYEAGKAMVDAAIKGGVNYFDTAYGYHGGQSQVFIGKALAAYPRNSFYLATKMPMWHVEKEEDTLRLFNEQLAACGVEYFDFYLFHAVNKDSYQKIARFKMWEKIAALKAEGKIRHIGFSFHDSPDVLETICSEHPWDFAQIQLNYLDWDGEQNSAEQYAILERHGMPCIVMEPVRGGRLADLGEQANAVLKAAAPQRSIASWAVRYAAGLPNVMTVLSGMSTLPQVEDNLATFTPFSPLSVEERAALDKALTTFREVALVPCTACRYCMPCPSGVDIPGLFKLRNDHAFDGGPGGFKQDYGKFPAESNAGHCVACGACEAACPQHIGIIEQMQKMDAATG